MSNPFGKPLNQGAAPAASVQQEPTQSAPVQTPVTGGNPFGRALTPIESAAATMPTPPPPVESHIREIKETAIADQRVKRQREGSRLVQEATDFVSGALDGLSDLMGLDNPNIQRLKQNLHGRGTGLSQHTAIANTSDGQTQSYDSDLLVRAREAHANDPAYRDDTLDEVVDKIKKKDMVDIAVTSQVANPMTWGTLAINNPIVRGAVTATLGGAANLGTEELKAAIDDRDRTNTDRAIDFGIGAATTGAVDYLVPKAGDVLQDAAKKVGNVIEPTWQTTKRLFGKADEAVPTEIPYNTPTARQNMAVSSAKAIGSEVSAPYQTVTDSMYDSLKTMRESFPDADSYVPKAVPPARDAKEIIDERLSLVGNHNDFSRADITRRAHLQLGSTPEGIRRNVANIIGSNNPQAINEYIENHVESALKANTRRIRGQVRKGQPRTVTERNQMVQEDRITQSDFEGVTARDLLHEPDALIARLNYYDDAMTTAKGTALKDLRKDKARFMKDVQGTKGFDTFMKSYAQSRVISNTLRDAGITDAGGNVLVGRDLTGAVLNGDTYSKQLAPKINKLPKPQQVMVRGQLVAGLMKDVNSVETYRQLIQFRPRIIQDLPQSMRTKFDGLDKALFRPLGDNLPIETVKEIQKVILNRSPSDKELLTLLDSIAQSRSDKVIDKKVQRLVKTLDKRGLPITSSAVIAGTLPDNE
ncbi:TPA: hypothetical protein P0E36_005231 [Vibrio harveyi]|nr:hypothetical protein [Vibrio harveyi]